jgi:hypothetical protein
LNDGIGYVRQGADAQGQAVSSWLFDPDGAVLEGPQGPVSHLICGGVYDWSTGLIFRDGRYFDPTLGIWLALAPLVVVQSWQGRRRKRRRGMPWYVLVLVIVSVGGMVTACGGNGGGTPTPACVPIEGYARDPRHPGRDDADILDASVIIEPLHNIEVQTVSLGTIVGQDGNDWIIYTHSHFEEGGPGLELHKYYSIKIHNHDMSHSVVLLMKGTNPDGEVEEKGERTKLKVRKSLLDGSDPRVNGKSIGEPIGRKDGVELGTEINIGDEVDLAYLAPPGVAGGDHVEIWHTRIVDRPTLTGSRPRTVAALGVPVSGNAFGPGAEGDSGGGLFLNGEHIGNLWLWIPVICRPGGIEIGHEDAVWISYLNP